MMRNRTNSPRSSTSRWAGKGTAGTPKVWLHSLDGVPGAGQPPG